MFTIAFLTGAAERAAKSFAQALLAVVSVTGLTFGDIDWRVSLSAAGLTALASVLTSIVNPTFTAGTDQGIGIEQIGDTGTEIEAEVTEPDPVEVAPADDVPAKHPA
ncbi:holin [Galactobacter caseinivorans]|uniref:Holin n=1 Tax=Galactobacter caseinivorans TaxID=2676123 RepID=A0A496PMN8_9MICC|nr:holin [Galactobacter caseinivorans]RKW71795.1 hypothetical protein DWQ67_02905 [Galactobacter caseinivorans]